MFDGQLAQDTFKVSNTILFNNSTKVKWIRESFFNWEYQYGVRRS
jgi:hypothetical protein